MFCYGLRGYRGALGSVRDGTGLLVGAECVVSLPCQDHKECEDAGPSTAAAGGGGSGSAAATVSGTTAKAGLNMLSSLIGGGSAEGFKLNLFPDDGAGAGGVAGFGLRSPSACAIHLPEVSFPIVLVSGLIP
jgi:hypothetical protein